MIKNEVPILMGENYKQWKEHVLFHLGVADLDYALRKDEPIELMDSSTSEEIALYKRWERSNRLSNMFIKTRISASMRGSILKCQKVKNFMKAIDDQFEGSEKALASTLMSKFSSMRLIGVVGMRKHIMEIRDLVAQLKSL